jgi:predicted thioesterase
MQENKNRLVPGKSATATTTVTQQNTALAVGSGSLPVFATPMMVALMEKAACNALEGQLEEGQTSVGTYISTIHTAASPVGALITAEATVTNVDGRMIEFEVSAKDGTGEIGIGTHKRAIITIEKFMGKTQGRV